MVKNKTQPRVNTRYCHSCDDFVSDDDMGMKKHNTYWHFNVHCLSCKQTFSSGRAYQEHTMKSLKHRTGNYDCRVRCLECRRDFNNYHQWAVHSSSHMLYCKECHIYLVNDIDLAKHEKDTLTHRIGSVKQTSAAKKYTSTQLAKPKTSNSQEQHPVPIVHQKELSNLNNSCITEQNAFVADQLNQMTTNIMDLKNDIHSNALQAPTITKHASIKHIQDDGGRTYMQRQTRNEMPLQSPLPLDDNGSSDNTLHTKTNLNHEDCMGTFDNKSQNDIGLQVNHQDSLYYVPGVSTTLNFGNNYVSEEERRSFHSKDTIIHDIKDLPETPSALSTQRDSNNSKTTRQMQVLNEAALMPDLAYQKDESAVNPVSDTNQRPHLSCSLEQSLKAKLEAPSPVPRTDRESRLNSWGNTTQLRTNLSRTDFGESPLQDTNLGQSNIFSTSSSDHQGSTTDDIDDSGIVGHDNRHKVQTATSVRSHMECHGLSRTASEDQYAKILQKLVATQSKTIQHEDRLATLEKNHLSSSVQTKMVELQGIIAAKNVIIEDERERYRSLESKNLALTLELIDLQSKLKIQEPSSEQRMQPPQYMIYDSPLSHQKILSPPTYAGPQQTDYHTSQERNGIKMTEVYSSHKRPISRTGLDASDDVCSANAYDCMRMSEGFHQKKAKVEPRVDLNRASVHSARS